jgi:hypothetical protein
VSAFLEIVELVNGDIVLQRAGGDGEALMTIRFSEESKAYLPEERLEVARAMIHAGIESASQMEFVKPEDMPEKEVESLPDGVEPDDLASDRTLH